MKTLEKQMDESLITERLVASLSTAFGILATILAAIGIVRRDGLHGGAAHPRNRRAHGVGRGQGDVVWLVMREVAILTVAGIGVGLAAAWGLTNLVRQQLYGVQPNDFYTVAGAALAIALVSAVSAYLPARRASHVDPLLSLRWE